MIQNIVKQIHENEPIFWGYRVSPYNITNTNIPYDGVMYDTKNALNLKTGEYKVPVKGNYSIFFSGLKRFVEPMLTLTLLHNNAVVTVKQLRQDLTDSPSSRVIWIPIFIAASLDLDVGDTVSVQLNTGGIYDTDKNDVPKSRLVCFFGYLIKKY